MSYTHKEILQAERTFDRAIGALQYFAGRDDMKSMRVASHVLAEVRHAAMTLCDESQTVASKEATVSQLIASIFTTLKEQA